jgi:hypothetical protein
VSDGYPKLILFDTDASVSTSRKRPRRIFLTVLEVGIVIWLFGSMFILPVQATPLHGRKRSADLKPNHARIGARQDARTTGIEPDIVHDDEPTSELGLWTSDTPDHTETLAEPSSHLYPSPTLLPTQDVDTSWHTELESSVETGTWIVSESALDHLPGQTSIASETSIVMPTSSDIATNIADVGTSEPPMNPLALIPLFMVIGCGLVFWLKSVEREDMATGMDQARGANISKKTIERWTWTLREGINASGRERTTTPSWMSLLFQSLSP